ncbi:MLO-like protein 1 isoform X2 [Juglans microcarpa x Juglans regia]|uniref:MLO-like protein 1 isoform X2 n=1 Tax=Juglans microcarpa x Juglans regia TaxID=2249226 RepID=UPI001B7E2322|nr:MLO-like protein 1 isoform X2 [Juglans microcarpa x Juglans regia]
MSGGEGEEATLEYTPTWVVAAVCTVIVAISLAVERLIHFTGKKLQQKNQKPLFEALQKVKEELMILGFISLLLTVFQNTISKICVPEDLTRHMLPCKLEEGGQEESITNATTAHFGSFFVSTISGKARRLLSEEVSSSKTSYCSRKIRQWKNCEDEIAKENYDPNQVMKTKTVTHVHQHAFIKDHFLGIGKNTALLGWLHSFVKQFYASVTKSDYKTLRLGFIMTHCRGNPKFNFHKYMMRALEDDFKQVVGISWYLWVFVVIFLLMNINGWHTYFWIAFIPFILLLAVGTKLEHVITQLAQEVAEKHVAIEGELVVQPSDEHFWFGRPRVVLFLIHFILFQNSFEIAFFFWIWVQYGFDSCIMGQVRYIVPRLIIGVFIQVFCSYSTLPLYAIVTQMGSNFKKSIFDEHVQAGLVGWAQKVKKKKGLKAANNDSGQGSSHESTTVGIQMGAVFRKASTPEEIQPAPGPEGSK